MNSSLVQFRRRGWAVFTRVIGDESLLAAQRAWSSLNPTRTAAAPDPWYGIRPWPTGSWALDELALSPAVVDLAACCVEADDLVLLRADFQQKDAGLASFEQRLHFDREDTCLVQPAGHAGDRAVALFVYLSDVTLDHGPTMLVASADSERCEPGRRELARDESPGMYRSEIPAVGQAGSILAFNTRTFHRASDLRYGRRITLNLAFAPRRPWYGADSDLPQRLDARPAFRDRLTAEQRRLVSTGPWEPWANEVVSVRGF